MIPKFIYDFIMSMKTKRLKTQKNKQPRKLATRRRPEFSLQDFYVLEFLLKEVYASRGGGGREGDYCS